MRQPPAPVLLVRAAFTDTQGFHQQIMLAQVVVQAVGFKHGPTTLATTVHLAIQDKESKDSAVAVPAAVLSVAWTLAQVLRPLVQTYHHLTARLIVVAAVLVVTLLVLLVSQPNEAETAVQVFLLFIGARSTNV